MVTRIYLAGDLAVEIDGELVLDDRRLRGQARLVFAYLVCHRDHAVSRETLADVLWQDSPPHAWGTDLSSVLSRLRSVLGGSTADVGSISRDPRLSRLSLPVDSWIDLEVALSSLDEAEGTMRNGATNEAWGAATVAVSILRRPFLAGVEAPWADAKREQLKRQLIRALDCLSTIWLDAGDAGLAIEAAAQAVELDPLRERSCQLLMSAHAAAGNRAQSLRIYQRLRSLLAAELGIDPAAETEALYLQILN